MARIRTIKPELPQSESMGRISRESRLLFIQLFTLVDDSGRARASSRLLASLLYPYDSDAPELIDKWLNDLNNEGCVTLYDADGNKYLQITNWLKHQKIDRPSESKIPPFDESSRVLASPRGDLAPDLGSRILDLGSRTVDMDQDHYVEKSDSVPVDPVGTVNRTRRIPFAEIEEILEFLNMKTGKSFKAKRPDGSPTANAKAVQAILKAGYSDVDCTVVICKKFDQWYQDEKMRGYLTPETLFRKSNFDKYIAECPFAPFNTQKETT